MRGLFSLRTGWDTGESSLSGKIRAAGAELLDLTVSNPTVCGFTYDAEGILAALARPECLTYDPDPCGMRLAREAVAGYYGGAVGAGECVLTTSTSEAYSFLFRLLCDAGDEVLVGSPGYPLFDFLAGLDDVRLESYPLFWDYGWWIDFAELERKIGPRTRAVIVVHPNNPTGHVTGAAERRQLEELCARRGLALIVDEVFLDYGLAGPVESFAKGEHACLKFVLSGLSKVAALPQMKVGWVVALGPGASEALARLEVIADTFLSMNAPVQLALATLLEGRGAIQRQVLGRVRENLAALALDGLDVLPVQAGWSAVVRVPGGFDVEQLLEDAGVVVHPGSFYGLRENRVVVSLIGPTGVMREGARKLKGWIESR